MARSAGISGRIVDQYGEPIEGAMVTAERLIRQEGRITARTGGKAYWAKTWQKQVEAFESIREDLGNSYTVTYYPAPNPNEGFRKISVEILPDIGKKYRVRSRPGYRPRA